MHLTCVRTYAYVGGHWRKSNRVGRNCITYLPHGDDAWKTQKQHNYNTGTYNNTVHVGHPPLVCTFARSRSPSDLKLVFLFFQRHVLICKIKHGSLQSRQLAGSNRRLLNTACLFARRVRPLKGYSLTFRAGVRLVHLLHFYHMVHTSFWLSTVTCTVQVAVEEAKGMMDRATAELRAVCNRVVVRSWWRRMCGLFHAYIYIYVG